MNKIPGPKVLFFTNSNCAILEEMFIPYQFQGSASEVLRQTV